MKCDAEDCRNDAKRTASSANSNADGQSKKKYMQATNALK